MIALKEKELLAEANSQLQQQPWATENMELQEVEQKGSTLVFYGVGFIKEDGAQDGNLIPKLDVLAQSLSKKFKLLK